MDDEIDLRIYVRVLLRRWWWIAGLGVFAAVLGLVGSFLRPAVYQAQALVVTTEPSSAMEWGTAQGKPASSVLAALATSDEVKEAVVEAYSPLAGAQVERWDLEALSEMMTVGTQADGSVLVLMASARTPQVASSTANLWADVLVEKGSSVYGETAQEVTLLEVQVTHAGQALDEADAALIEFQGSSRASTLQAQLSSLTSTHTILLSTQFTIANTIEDARSLRDRLAMQPAGQPASLADNLTLLLMYIGAYNVDTPAPIQLQISSAEALFGLSSQEQIATLDRLAAALQDRLARIDVRLIELEPQILTAQQELEQVRADLNRLTLRQTLAKETYWLLARKLEKTRLAAETGQTGLHVGSYAAVPQVPTSRHTLRNTVIAGVAGMMLGTLVAFAAELWKK